MGVIDEVKQKTDIIEVIGQHTKLTKAGRTYRGLCPFHSEKHGSFFVYPEQQTWHCFGACNTGGDVLTFVMKKEAISFGEALRLLAEKTGVMLPARPGGEERKEEKEELYKVSEAAAQYFHNLLLNSAAAGKARSYVASRGILPKTLTDFQLGFSQDDWESLKRYLMERGYTEAVLLTAGLILQADNGRTHDRFRGRLMFPIRDARGRTIGFGARALDDSMPKYLNSPQTPLFDKSGNLYGIDMAAGAIRQQDMAVIVEGYMDVIIAHQYGVANVVASMGTAITEKQVTTLRRLTKNLVLALDADAAGEEAMLRGVAYENRLDTEVRVVILPEGKDPDEVIKEDTRAWQQLVEKGLPVMDYAFDMATAKLDLTSTRGQAEAVKKLGPIIVAIDDQVRYEHYAQKLAQITKKDPRTIEKVLSTMKHSPGKQTAQQSKQEAIARALHPLVSNPREEYCLALLLKYPELKGVNEDICPEYFENSENREIFSVWQATGDLPSLRERLDFVIHEHLDAVANKNLPAKNVEQRYSDCVLQLRKQYLRNLEAKRAAILALEVELGGPGADLAKLEESGIEPSQQLKEVFTQKIQSKSELKR